MNNSLHSVIFLHSLLRYFVLIATAVAATLSLIGLLGKKDFTAGNKKSALFMMIFCDIQLLVGLAVYYLSGQMQIINTGAAMQSHYNRFYAIEHPVGMVVAIILIHLGYNVVKKNISAEKKLKRLFWYSFIALVIFLTQTPWPTKQDVGKPWLPATSVTN